MQALSPTQIDYLTQLRHELHRRPELSGEEAETAQRIITELTALNPDRIWTWLL